MCGIFRGSLHHIITLLSVIAAGAALLAGCGRKNQDTVGAADNRQTYDLRVYGKLNVSEPRDLAGGGRVLTITAENHDKALVVIGKLLSDFTTVVTVKPEDVAIGKTLPALSFDGGRKILPVLRAGENAVDVLMFDDAAQWEKFAAAPSSEAAKIIAGAVAVRERTYPFFLDRWDRHAMGVWYGNGSSFWSSEPGLTPEDDFAFMQKHGLGINMGDKFRTLSVRAAKHGIGYKINRWFDASAYIYDARPELAVQSDPDMNHYHDYYGEVPFADNELERGIVAEIIPYLAQFTKDEYFESICLPRGETGPGWISFQGYRERGESARQDFIHYLRDLRQLTLAGLGERWYGDAGRFKTWDDVKFPREREFYGWQDGASQSLAGVWRLRNADRQVGEQEKLWLPETDDRRWVAYDHPAASQYLAAERTHEARGGWMRTAFTVDENLLAAAKTQPVYLTVCPFNFAPYSDPSAAWLNGVKLGEMTRGWGQEWGQYDVTKLLKPGKNSLTVYGQNARVSGPTFLTPRRVEEFPTSDAGLNARLYDVREWVADAVARANLRYLKYVREIDNARPVKIMAFDGMIDIMMPYAQEWGAYPHCTGESAFFRPWFKRYGYLRGIQDSSEPSGSPGNLVNTKHLFFDMTLEGVNGHDLFYNLHAITGVPEIKDWYEKNVEYYKLMGRFDLKKPDIAIARSIRAGRVAPQEGDTGYLNDPGRGDFQSAHYSWVYGAERDLHDGMLDNYKVIFDNNFNTLDPADVDRLEQWVKAGGTLVLNGRSGRHTYLRREAWPIEQLTGCVAAIRPQEGKVTFVADPVILRDYAGQSFVNRDNLYDWQKVHYFTDCVALQPKDGVAVDVIARYDDGAPAIVSRELGKGRVVVLGSNFYREANDIRGYFIASPAQTKFFKTLFRDLGLAPVVESDHDRLWAERFIANNGSTEMLIVGNQDIDIPLQNISVVWQLDFAPCRVFDPVTGATLPVKIDGSRVTIDGLNIPPNELRYYAVERVDESLAGHVNHWLKRQRDMWRAVPPGTATPPLPANWPIQPNGDWAVKSFTDEAEARAAMRPDLKLDDTWREMLPSDWISAGLPTGADRRAVYRKVVDISPAWLAGLRAVQPAMNPSYADGTLEVQANGTVIFKNSRPVAGDEALRALKPGKNVLTVLTGPGKPDGNGGFSGDFALLRVPGAGAEVMELNKGWTIWAAEDDSYETDFPAEGQWKMASKKVWIPESLRDSGEVWMEVTSRDPHNACAVAVNGRYRYRSISYGARFRLNPLIVNVTPDIKYGAENRIVLGGVGWHAKFRLADTDYQQVRLLFVPKKK